METVLEEIEKRIKRLEAEIELAELSFERMEKSLKGEQLLKKASSYSFYYLIFMVIWMIAGLLFLVGLKNRLPTTSTFPVVKYGLLFILMFLIPVVYFVWINRETEEITTGIELREKWARTVITRFYIPLREALEKGDEAKLAELADSLLENMELAQAVEKVHEGDPKIMAYALYLYIRRSPELKNEIREVSERITNKPLKKLLLLAMKDL